MLLKHTGVTMSAHKALSLLLLVVTACEGASLVLKPSTQLLSKDGEANFTLNCTNGQSQIQNKIVDVQKMSISKMQNNRWEPIAQMESDWQSPVIHPGIDVDFDVASGFIQATWPMVDSITGEYICDMVGDGVIGQRVSLRSPVVYVNVQFSMMLHDLFKMVNTSSKKVETLSANVARNKEAITLTSAVIAENKEGIEEASADIARNKEEIEEALSDIAKNKEGIERASIDISQNEEAIDAGSGDIIWIKTQFDTASTDIARNRKVIDTLSADITRNENEIHSASADIVENKKAIEGTSENITQNKEVIQETSADIMWIKNEFDTALTNITQNKEAIEIASAGIARNKEAIDKSSADIIRNENAINKGSAEIARNEEVITQTKTGQNNFSSLIRKTSNTVRSNAAMFAQVKQKQDYFTGFFQRWPQGSYNLIRPRSGCPRDTATTDWRYHSPTIPTDSRVTTSTGSHVDLFGSSNTIMFMWLCSVGDSPSLGGLWPRGTYCINKDHRHACPTGFREGDITYFFSLSIYYCCRDDSPPNIAILLPREKPFYLYRIGGKCQHVWGMSVTEEYIRIYTKCCDSKYTDPVPDGKKTSSEITLQLCYYETDTK